MLGRQLILNFHGVGDPPPHVDGTELRVWVGAEVLERTLDAVARRERIQITFDDGNRSDVELALPALRARGMRARFFVLAGRLGQPGYLGPAELAELAEAGMGVGSHGVRHRPWRSLGTGELREELAGSRAALEDVLGRPVTEAA